MKTLLWKAYYRLKFKKNYNNRIQNAALLLINIKDSSKGNLSHFYNSQGEQIRGWHRKRPAFVTSTDHPLTTYYKNR